MDSGKSVGMGMFLFLEVVGVGGVFGVGENVVSSEDEDVVVGEFFFEFMG